MVDTTIFAYGMGRDFIYCVWDGVFFYAGSEINEECSTIVVALDECIGQYHCNSVLKFLTQENWQIQ